MNSDFSDIALALSASIAADGQTPITAPLKFPSGTSLAPSHTFSSDLTTGMYYIGSGKLGFAGSGNSLVVIDGSKVGSGQDGSILTYANGAALSPVGQVSWFAGTAAPPGWFLCYGQTISRVAYPELFFVIGTTYGNGDGSTTFGLPDLRGRAAFGRDDMGGLAANRITNAVSGITGTTLGASGGSQSITLIVDNLPAYTPEGTVSISDTRTWRTHDSVVFQNGVGPGVIGAGPVVTVGQVAIETSGGSISGSFTGTAQGGTSAPAASIPPALILNAIIFAGRT